MQSDDTATVSAVTIDSGSYQATAPVRDPDDFKTRRKADGKIQTCR
jgi:hypothetical protein